MAHHDKVSCCWEDDSEILLPSLRGCLVLVAAFAEQTGTISTKKP